MKKLHWVIVVIVLSIAVFAFMLTMDFETQMTVGKAIGLIIGGIMFVLIMPRKKKETIQMEAKKE